MPNAHFIIVGNGNQETKIRKYAEDNNFSESLHITGWVDNPMSYVEIFDGFRMIAKLSRAFAFL